VIFFSPLVLEDLARLNIARIPFLTFDDYSSLGSSTDLGGVSLDVYWCILAGVDFKLDLCTCNSEISSFEKWSIEYSIFSNCSFDFSVTWQYFKN
jgi:hypothetical protein